MRYLDISEIECVDWQKYDIEVRHPEIIFTFNGYDEYNLVYEVHPISSVNG